MCQYNGMNDLINGIKPSHSCTHLYNLANSSDYYMISHTETPLFSPLKKAVDQSDQLKP